MSIWNNPVDLLILIAPIMFANLRKLCTVWSELLKPSSTVLVAFFGLVVLCLPLLILLCLFFALSHILILLLYVDDIILTGCSSKLLYSFISTLSNQFAKKDLGDLHYFLDIWVKHDSTNIFLSQRNYAVDLLYKFHLYTVKLVTTPSGTRTLLSLTNSELCADPIEYWSTLGALQYLIMTRPNNVYVVHVVFQFVHTYRTTLLHAFKHIFGYLHGIQEYGM